MAAALRRQRRRAMPKSTGRAAEIGGSMTILLLILLAVVVIGVLPRWGYSRGWGYGPSGLLGIGLVVLLVLVLTNTIRI
jgi:hypothetical protein